MKKKISILTALAVSLFSAPIVNLNSIDVKAEEPIEIMSLRSEYGKHFDNGDGTKTAYISTVPIHYLENNEWVEIDNSLTLYENGNYTNSRSPFSITVNSDDNARYYIITKDTNLYNSWHGMHISSGSTPYHQ